jgi:hypothetical protein
MGKGAKPWCEKHRCIKNKWLKMEERFVCPQCLKEYNKQYRQKHRSERAAYSRQYYQQHRSERAAHSRQYYQQHRAEILQAARANKILPLRVVKLFQLINAVSTLTKTKENTTNENTNISSAVNSQ